MQIGVVYFWQLLYNCHTTFIGIILSFDRGISCNLTHNNLFESVIHSNSCCHMVNRLLTILLLHTALLSSVNKKFDSL